MRTPCEIQSRAIPSPTNDGGKANLLLSASGHPERAMRRLLAILLAIAALVLLWAAKHRRSLAQEEEIDEPASPLYIECGEGVLFVERLAWLEKEQRWSEYADLCIETIARGDEEICYLGKGEYRPLGSVALEKLTLVPQPIMTAIARRREAAGRALLERGLAENNEAAIARVFNDYIFVPAGIDAALALTRRRFEAGAVLAALAIVERALSSLSDQTAPALSASLPIPVQPATVAQLRAYQLLCRKIAGLSPAQPGKSMQESVEEPDEKGPGEDHAAVKEEQDLRAATVLVEGRETTLGDFEKRLFPEGAGEATVPVRGGQKEWPTAAGANSRVAQADIELARPVLTWSFSLPDCAREPWSEMYGDPGDLTRRPTASPQVAPPHFAATAGGVVYATDRDALYAIEIATGEMLWVWGREGTTRPRRQQTASGAQYSARHPTGCAIAGEMVVAAVGRSEADRSVLVACDSRTGQQLWILEARQMAERGSRATILGPPVCALGRAFAPLLVSSPQEVAIHLVCASLHDGKLLWNRFICSTPRTDTLWGGQFQEYNLAANAWNTAIAESAGTILIGTAVGVLAAIDCASGKLLWLWDTNEIASKRDKRTPRENVPHSSARQTIARSTLCFPVVVGGICFYPDLQAGVLFGIELATGKMAVSKAIRDLGPIDGRDGTALLMSGPRVQALKTPSLKLFWSALKPLVVTGKGLVSSSSRFLVPSSEGLLAFDIPTGKVVIRSPWMPVTRSSGHLAVADGVLLVTDGDSVRCFADWSQVFATFEERLARNPPDLKAYLERADILAFNNMPAEALADLEAFIVASTDVETARAELKEAGEKHVVLSMALAAACSKNNEPAEAIAVLTRSLSLVPDSPYHGRLLPRLIDELLVAGRWHEAAGAIARLVRRDPQAEIEASAGLFMPAWNFAALRLAEVVAAGGDAAVAYLETLAGEFENVLPFLEFTTMFAPTHRAFARLEENWRNLRDKGDFPAAACAALLWWRTCPEPARAAGPVAALAESLAKLGDSTRLSALLETARELYADVALPGTPHNGSLIARIEQLLGNCAPVENKNTRGEPSNSFPGELVTAFDLKEGGMKARAPTCANVYVPFGLRPPENRTSVIVSRDGRLEYWCLAEGRCMWVTTGGLAKGPLLGVGYVSARRLVAVVRADVFSVDVETGKVLWKSRLPGRAGASVQHVNLAFGRGTVLLLVGYAQTDARDSPGRRFTATSLLALDAVTGALMWRQNFEGILMQFASEREPFTPNLHGLACYTDSLAASEMAGNALCLVPSSPFCPGGAPWDPQEEPPLPGVLEVDVRYGYTNLTDGGKRIRPLRRTAAEATGGGQVFSLIESPYETLTTLTFVRTMDGVVAWNLATGEQKWSLSTRRPLTFIRVLPIEKGIVALGTSGSLSLHDARTGTRRVSLPDRPNRIVTEVVLLDCADVQLAIAHSVPDMSAVEVAIYRLTETGLEQVWTSREENLDFLHGMSPVHLVCGIPKTLVLCGRLTNVQTVQREGEPPRYIGWVSIALSRGVGSDWRIAWESKHEMDQASHERCPWWVVLEGFRIVDTPAGCKVYW